jgi:predicted kinase
MKAIITIGCSASGKTTWADQQKGFMVIERDTIRRGLMNHAKEENMWNHWDFKRENEVTEQYTRQLETCANHGMPVICADTNLNKKYRDLLHFQLTELGYEVEYKVFDVEYGVLLKRDTGRLHSVGQQVIARQWKQWTDSEFYPFQKIETRGNIPAIIVDIDGTIALHNSGRGPFEYHRVNEDTPAHNVIALVKTMSKNFTPIFVSGRSDICRQLTAEWIMEHVGIDPILFMRKDGDNRNDGIVKYEIYRDLIAPMYNVYGAFDDRPKVARMFRAIGIQVFQVGNPHIEF